MKIAFLGDSITEGVGASSFEFCYAQRVGKKLGCEVLNYGLRGSRIARTTVANTYHRRDIDFNLRVPLFDKSVDKFFVFGGTNDYGHGCAPMGKIGDYGEYTFHGAVNKLFSTLLGMYGRDNVFVIFPLKRANIQNTTNAVTGKYLKDYVEIIRYYAQLYGFKYLDLYNDGLPEPPEGESEYFVDGLHPNDKGHEIIAEKIYMFIKNDK